MVRLSPVSRAQIPLFQRSWGLRPRLYASACFAGSKHSSQIRKEIDQRCGQEDVEQRERQQDPPAKIHQLIKTKARQRSAQPDINKEKYANLNDESQRAHESEHKRATTENQVQEGHVPATPKERGREHRNRKHVDVFSEE